MAAKSQKSVVEFDSSPAEGLLLRVESKDAFWELTVGEHTNGMEIKVSKILHLSENRLAMALFGSAHAGAIERLQPDGSKADLYESYYSSSRSVLESDYGSIGWVWNNGQAW